MITTLRKYWVDKHYSERELEVTQIGGISEKDDGVVLTILPSSGSPSRSVGLSFDDAQEVAEFILSIIPKKRRWFRR